MGALALIFGLIPALTTTARAATNSDLSISKTGSPDPVKVGETIQYTLTIINSGMETVPGVVGLDRLPDEVSFGAASDSKGSSCGFDGTFARCEIGMMAPGTITMTVLGTVTSFPEGGKLTNFATVFPDDDPNPSNNHTSIQTTVTTDEGQPLLGIEKVDLNRFGDPVKPGGSITYRITVFNDGTADAANVVMGDVIPIGTVPDFPLPAGCVEKFLFGRSVVQCSLGTISPEGEVVIDLVLDVLENVEPGSTLVNTATADADNTEPVLDSEASFVASTPLLTIDKTETEDPVEVGEETVYVITVKNEGKATARNVKVQDTLPKEVEFKKAIPRKKCRRINRVVNCKLGDLAPGQEAVVTIRVKAKDDAVKAGKAKKTVTNVAKATADNADPATDREKTVIFNPKKGAVLLVDKTDTVDPVEPGDEIFYPIKVTNIGDETATGMVVDDVLPSGVTFVSGSHGCAPPSDLAPEVIRCPDVPDLAPGESVTVLIVAAVTGDFASTAEIENLALAEGDNASSRNDTETTLIFVGTPVLQVEKSEGADPVGIGEETTYALFVTNVGNGTARGVTATDHLPAALKFVPGTSDPACSLTSSAGGRDLVDCALPDLRPGETASVVIGVRVQGPVEHGTTVENVGGAEADNAALVQDSITTTLVTAAPDLNVKKESLTDAVQVGDMIRYRVLVFNDGTGTAENVTVSDRLPSNVTPGDPGDDCQLDSPGGDPTFECQLGDIPPHEFVAVEFEVGTTEAGDVVNEAIVTSDNHDEVASTITTPVGFCPGFANDPRNQILGTDGPDVLTGTGEDDIICAFDGNDEIQGGGGNDLILAGPGHDSASGGGGNDEIDGDVGNDFIEGGGGNDVLIGGPEVDTSLGGDVDTVNGGDGNDTIQGGADPDTLLGSRDNDNISGGDGDDTISGSHGADLLVGGGGDDNIDGGDKKDVIEGEQGSDLINGGGGPDVIRGGDDGDILKGGPSDDKLFGQAGDDFLEGQGGRDTLVGGPDKDSLDGGPDKDTCEDQKKGTEFKSCEKT